MEPNELRIGDGSLKMIKLISKEIIKSVNVYGKTYNYYNIFFLKDGKMLRTKICDKGNKITDGYIQYQIEKHFIF